MEQYSNDYYEYFEKNDNVKLDAAAVAAEVKPKSEYEIK